MFQGEQVGGAGDEAEARHRTAQIMQLTLGILGGHGELRGSETYESVARIAYALGQKNFTVLTGGGPGAMEAAHLGARYAPLGNAALADALTRISGDSSVICRCNTSTPTQPRRAASSMT